MTTTLNPAHPADRRRLEQKISFLDRRLQTLRRRAAGERIQSLPVRDEIRQLEARRAELVAHLGGNDAA